jgi:hypothetical protein
MKGSLHTSQLTHPEIFVRARALELWAEKESRRRGRNGDRGDDRGPPTIAPLDLLAQRRLPEQTRRFVTALLVTAWFRSDAVVAHVRRPQTVRRAGIPGLLAWRAVQFIGGGSLCGNRHRQSTPIATPEQWH